MCRTLPPELMRDAGIADLDLAVSTEIFTKGITFFVSLRGFSIWNTNKRSLSESFRSNNTPRLLYINAYRWRLECHHTPSTPRVSHRDRSNTARPAKALAFFRSKRLDEHVELGDGVLLCRLGSDNVSMVPVCTYTLHVCIDIYVNTVYYIHTYIQTYIHTNIHTNIHTYKHTYR